MGDPDYMWLIYIMYMWLLLNHTYDAEINGIPISKAKSLLWILFFSKKIDFGDQSITRLMAPI